MKFTKGNNRAAKLTNEQVFEMRQLYAIGGWSQGELARKFEVQINTVGRIVRGESRQAVPMSIPSEDREATQKRLEELQAEQGQAVVEGLVTQAQKVYEKEVKPAKELDRLVNWPAAEKFGVKE